MPRRSMQHNIEVLEAAGYDLTMLKGYLNLKDLERRGVAQVWECGKAKCRKDDRNRRYESPIRITEISCPSCRGAMRLIWPK